VAAKLMVSCSAQQVFLEKTAKNITALTTEGKVYVADTLKLKNK
jgi:hypothetical protein